MSGTTTPSPWSVENYDTYLQNKKTPQEAYKYLRLSPYDRKEDKKVTRQEAEDTLNANTDVKNVIGNLLSIAGFRETFLDTLIKRTIERTGETVTTDPTPVADTEDIKKKLRDQLEKADKQKRSIMIYGDDVSNQRKNIENNINGDNVAAEQESIAKSIERYTQAIVNTNEEQDKIVTHKRELKVLLEKANLFLSLSQNGFGKQITQFNNDIQQIHSDDAYETTKKHIEAFMTTLRDIDAFKQKMDTYNKQTKKTRLEMFNKFNSHKIAWGKLVPNNITKWKETLELDRSDQEIKLAQSKQELVVRVDAVKFDPRLHEFDKQKQDILDIILKVADESMLKSVESKQLLEFSTAVKQHNKALSLFKKKQTESLQGIEYPDEFKVIYDKLIKNVEDCYQPTQFGDLKNKIDGFKEKVETCLRLRKEAKAKLSAVEFPQDVLLQQTHMNVQTCMDTIFNRTDFNKFDEELNAFKTSVQTYNDEIRVLKDSLIAQIQGLQNHPNKDKVSNWTETANNFLDKMEKVSIKSDLDSIQTRVNERQSILNEADDDEKIPAKYQNFVTFFKTRTDTIELAYNECPQFDSDEMKNNNYIAPALQLIFKSAKVVNQLPENIQFPSKQPFAQGMPLTCSIMKTVNGQFWNFIFSLFKTSDTYGKSFQYSVLEYYSPEDFSMEHIENTLFTLGYELKRN